MNGTNLAMPFFNEEFLQGENSKKAKLGNVYKEVSFPFTQDEVFKESDATNANEKGVKYWYFDSDKTTLYLKNDPDNGGYFLQKQNALESKSKNLKSDSTPVEVKTRKESRFIPTASSPSTAGRVKTRLLLITMALVLSCNSSLP